MGGLSEFLASKIFGGLAARIGRELSSAGVCLDVGAETYEEYLLVAASRGEAALPKAAFDGLKSVRYGAMESAPGGRART